MPFRRLLNSTLLLALLVPGVAAQQADSTAQRPNSVKGWPLPKAVTWTGGALIVSALLDHTMRDLTQRNRGVASNALADAANHLGTVYQVGPALGVLWWAGKAFNGPRVSDAAGHALLAVAGAGLVTTGIKYTVGRYRPSEREGNLDFDVFRMDDSSFPSGHTAVAFALASTLAHETSDSWSDVLFYSGAIMTGLARVNNNRHWMSDVVGGAAIGFFSGYFVTRGHRVPIAVSPSGIAVRLEF